MNLTKMTFSLCF